MNDHRARHDSSRAREGEYIRGAYRSGNPTEALNELLEEASRFIAENPKKTAVIATAATAAAAAAAVTAAAAAAAFLVAGEIRDWLRGVRR